MAQCEGNNHVVLLGPKPTANITCVNGRLPVKVQSAEQPCDYNYECECESRVPRSQRSPCQALWFDGNSGAPETAEDGAAGRPRRTGPQRAWSRPPPRAAPGLPCECRRAPGGRAILAARGQGPGAAETEDRKLGGSKQRKVTVPVLETRSRGPGCGQDGLTPEALGRVPPAPSSSAPGVPGLWPGPPQPLPQSSRGLFPPFCPLEGRLHWV